MEVQPGGLAQIFVGYDPRESATYHVLTQSILNTTTIPVSIAPLHSPMLNGFDGQQDGTNAFIYSRFLVPYLMGYQGWAVYLDSDMLARGDLSHLWELRDDSKAVMVCQHDYHTKFRRKAIGTELESPNTDYPRKNWSSLILWNCGHPSNRLLTKEFVAEAGGRTLHRFSWLNDSEIGVVPKNWNHLVLEYPIDDDANLVHFTIGAPGFDHYKNCDYSAEWFGVREQVNHMVGNIDVKRRSA